MPQTLKLASAQSRTLSTTSETLHALERTTRQAAENGVDIILFPEAYLGGYPRTCTFGNAVGGRTSQGRDQFLSYFHAAVDLGDTPSGAGEDWLERRLELPKGKKYRGDGTREELECIARETGVFVVTGLVERCAGTLYCGALYVCPKMGVLGKRRKVMPTGSERMIWGQGSPSTLRAVTTEIKGVKLTMAAAICWENYMPLLRQSLYSQNVNLWLAPTADARDSWASLMRTIGIEGRCIVVSANQCAKKSQLPEWITGETATKATESQANNAEHATAEPSHNRSRRRSTITVTEDKHEICWPVAEEKSNGGKSLPNGDSSAIEDEPQTAVQTTKPKSRLSQSTTHFTAQAQADPNTDEFVSRGGSCIISPFGEVLSGPLWEKEDEMLIQEVDFEDCERGRLDIDVAGSYGRLDSFHLAVDGLDLNPPP